MRHTFKEFITHYEPITIQLIFAEHIVNIDTRIEGSFALVKAFDNFKFDFINFKNGHLLLRY